jgi:hypothetical protein
MVLANPAQETTPSPGEFLVLGRIPEPKPLSLSAFSVFLEFLEQAFLVGARRPNQAENLPAPDPAVKTADCKLAHSNLHRI